MQLYDFISILISFQMWSETGPPVSGPQLPLLQVHEQQRRQQQERRVLRPGAEAVPLLGPAVPLAHLRRVRVRLRHRQRRVQVGAGRHQGGRQGPQGRGHAAHADRGWGPSEKVLIILRSLRYTAQH